MKTTTKDPRGNGSRTPRETYIAPRDRQQLARAVESIEMVYQSIGDDEMKERLAKHHIVHAWAIVQDFLRD